MLTSNEQLRGFTLVELAITILILGMVIAMGIPAIHNMSQTQMLQSDTENVAAQLRMMRQRAISIGSAQTMHFSTPFVYAGTTSDYHIHNGTYVPAMWSFSKGITYYWGVGTSSVFVMNPDGTCSTSSMVILQNTRGMRDTVSVQLSGLVLTK
jgi:prepilin-type N-terminal cleavage/methylation domain-containing protein